MDSIIIDFSDMRAVVADSNTCIRTKDITYSITPSVAKNPIWKVVKSHRDATIETSVEDIIDYLTEQDDIYGPDEIVVHTGGEKIKYMFRIVLEHFFTREVLGEGEDAFDRDNYNWNTSNQFMEHCGLFAIITAHKKRAIKRFNNQFLADKECPVSREPLVAGETFKLPCEHLISRDSFIKLQGEKKCPLCRASVDGRQERI